MRTVKQLEVDEANFDDDFICISDGYDGVEQFYKDESLDNAIKKLLQEQLEMARHIEQQDKQIAELKDYIAEVQLNLDEMDFNYLKCKDCSDNRLWLIAIQNLTTPTQQPTVDKVASEQDDSDKLTTPKEK